jgi:hypothetical protein
MAAGRKPFEKRTKADLLEHLGRLLTKDELVSLCKATSAGYRPFSLEGGAGPSWRMSEKPLPPASS